MASPVVFMMKAVKCSGRGRADRTVDMGSPGEMPIRTPARENWSAEAGSDDGRSRGRLGQVIDTGSWRSGEGRREVGKLALAQSVSFLAAPLRDTQANNLY